jgi:hypothetical protein
MRQRGIEVAIWVGLGLLLIANALPSRDRIVGDGVDLYGTIWFFWWIRECVQSFSDPGWTQYFFFPYGKDVFGHTGNNFVDAALSIPLQWVLGTPGYYKWWVFTVFLANAAAFRLFVREEVSSRTAAAIATVLYATNPYFLYELQCGRPTQALTAFLVASFYLVRKVDRGWRDAVFCGIAVAITGWTYWFYAFFFGFACLWLVPAILWDHPDRRAFLRGLLVAAITAVILVLPAVIPMVLRDVQGNIPGIEHAHGWLELPRKINGTATSAVEGYLLWEPSGVRLFGSPAWGTILVGWAAFGGGRRKWLGVTAVALAVAFGLSARIDGHTVWSLPYVLLYNKLPFFDRLWFPYRAVSVAVLAASLGAGFLLARVDAAAARFGARGRWAMPALGVGLVVLSVGMSAMDGLYPLWAENAKAPAVYSWMAQRGGAILDLPRGTVPTYIVYQPQHRLPLFGGMGENVSLFWPPGHRRLLENGFVNALTHACRDPDKPAPAYTLADRDALVRLGFRWVVLHRELLDSEFEAQRADRGAHVVDAIPFVVTRRIAEGLGAPVAVDGSMVVWALGGGVAPPPPAIAPSDANLYTRVWERPTPAGYITRTVDSRPSAGP